MVTLREILNLKQESASFIKLLNWMEFAESKSASAGSDNGGYRPAMSQSRPEPASAVASGFMNIPDGVEDEGLPFN